MMFCPRCGAALPAAPSTDRTPGGSAHPTPRQCGRCAYQLYLNARPTASLILHDGAGRFLALRRAREPQAGLWETPGGFCDGWEEPSAAAVREGREELGVDVVLNEFVGMYVGGYLFQDELLPVLDCYWLARLPDGDRASDPPAEIRLDPQESSEMAWFSLATPPVMAFATMDRALVDAARILSGRGQPAR